MRPTTKTVMCDTESCPYYRQTATIEAKEIAPGLFDHPQVFCACGAAPPTLQTREEVHGAQVSEVPQGGRGPGDVVRPVLRRHEAHSGYLVDEKSKPDRPVPGWNVPGV